MRRASTTVAMQSTYGMASRANCGARAGMVLMVWAMGAGSQMPLASMTM